ncbi:hypothetical protein BpHYR1_006596 [Brachionus plicatilis]|uniref:Uncharacterized protein n=1 Tax=Brachionus plicatilis TaxID=10195 RepID=A0A3M7PUA7_BRAPC|nr:hypothetical protein BpHYR1_006596 [Brachionus plicatilis]
MNRTCDPKGVNKGIWNFVSKNRNKNLLCSKIHNTKIGLPNNYKEFCELNFTSANSFFIIIFFLIFVQ